MNNNLDVLIQLGDVDYRLKEIDELKGDLPQMVESQKNLIERLNSENEGNNVQLGDIEHKMTEKQASTVIGQKYADEYVKPLVDNLKKNK